MVETMKFFLMACSQQKFSLNKKLIHNCQNLLGDHATEIALMENYEMPGYNGDIEKEKGIPTIAYKLASKLLEVDRIIFSVPEYNYSIPGVFKNIIDWISRIKPMPWKGKRILVLTASPSIRGGNNAFWHTQLTLGGCSAYVFPETLSLSFAHQQFDENDNLKNQEIRANLKRLIEEFINF